MSLKLMVQVMEKIDVSRPQQAVLLAMAENAADDGTRCFPSVDLIAWKAGYKPRNVTDIIRDLRKSGVLEEVAPASGQRPTEYTIHLENAPQKPSFEEWQKQNGRHASRYSGVHSHEKPTRENAPVQNDEGCNLTGGGVHSHETGVHSHEKPTRENAPRTVSRTVIEPSGNRHGARERTAPPGDSKTKTEQKPKRARQIPPDWEPSERLRQWAIDDGFHEQDLVQQVPQFVDHWLGKGKPMLDWEATFRTWMRNAREWGRTLARSANSPPRNQPPKNLQTSDYRGDDESRWLGKYAEQNRSKTA